MCPATSKFVPNQTYFRFQTIKSSCRCSVKFLGKESKVRSMFTVRILVFGIFIMEISSWTHFLGTLIFMAGRYMWHYPCHKLSLPPLLKVGWMLLTLSSIAAKLSNYCCNSFHYKTSYPKCHSTRLTSRKKSSPATASACHRIQNMTSSNSQLNHH